MHRYNLSDEEKDWLKVAKLNQDKSEALLSEMKALNKEWGNINKSHEDFLSSVENMLGMRNFIIFASKSNVFSSIPKRLFRLQTLLTLEMNGRRKPPLVAVFPQIYSTQERLPLP